MRLRVGAATDTGRVRDLNEDAYALRPEQGLFVVCDGMGGCPAGEVASQIAVDTIIQQLHDNGRPAARVAAAAESYLARTSRLADAVRHSNQFIYTQAQSDPRQADMGTTVVAAWIGQSIASVAHVGDSRAYHWHGDRLEPLTQDHSLVEAQVRAGLLDPERREDSDQAHVLVRVLGREADVEVDVIEVPLQRGDYLLLCSDGLTRLVSERALARAIVRLRDPQRICDSLIAQANRNGGADNITVVIVEVAGVWRQIADRWSRLVAGGDRAKAHSPVR